MKIPDFTALGTNNPRSTGPISPSDSGSMALADSVKNLGNTVGQIGEEGYKRQANLALATADSQTIKGLLDLKDKIQSTDDYNNWQKDFDAQAPQVTSAVRGNLLGPETQGIYDTSAIDHTDRFSQQMGVAAKARREDVQRGSLAQLTQDNLDAYGKATDAQTRANILASTNEAITAASAPAAGRDALIDPATAVKMRKSFAVDVAKNYVEGLAPQDVIKLLGQSSPDRLSGASADSIWGAIHQQESGGRATSATSIDGAVGPGQIKPATFAQYAKSGEEITNSADNIAVGKRIVADYTQKYNGDPARVAVAYFSGPGNVAPVGSKTPWVRDARDGNGKSVSSYVADVTGRLPQDGSSSSEPASMPTKTGTPIDFLDEATKRTLYKQAISDERDQQTQVKQAVAAQQAQNEFDLGVAVDNGKVAPDDILAYEHQGTIAPTKALELYQKAQVTYGANDVVLSSLNSGIPLDPGNAKNRASVDHYWDKQVAPQLASQPPEQQAAATALFVEKTGIMPQGAVGQIRSAFRAGTVEQRVKAANMLDAVASTTPNALGSFDVAEIAQARSVAKMVREGVPAEQAVQYADKDGRMDKTLKDIRQSQLAVKTSNVSLADQSVAKISANLAPSGWISSGAKVPDVAQGEFKDLFTEAYLRTGDVDSSVKAATDAANRVWGISQINGGQTLMKYAPEKLFGIIDQGQNDSEWQRFQLVRDVTANGAFDASQGPVEDRINIGPDSRTARDGSYVVLLKNKDGAFEPIIGKSAAPLRWRPDVQGERDYLMQQKKNEAAANIKGARDLKTGLQDTLTGMAPLGAQ